MTRKNKAKGKRNARWVHYGFGLGEPQLNSNGSQCFRRPEGMSPEEFKRVARLAERPGYGDYSAVITDDYVVILENNHTDFGKEMSALTDRLTSFAPAGIGAAVILSEFGGANYRPYVAMVVTEGATPLQFDNALDAATHGLLFVFDDGKGFMMAGTLGALMTFLRNVTREEARMHWLRIYNARR